jgi:hypothetical protein
MRREREAPEKRHGRVRTTARRAAPAGVAATHLQAAVGNRLTGRMLQRLTYAVRHPTDTEDEWTDIVSDAQRLNRPPLVTDDVQFKGIDHAKLSARERQRLDIVAHGNQEDIGGKDPSALAQHLVKGCGMPLSVRKVVLHSCMSGSPDTRADRPTFGKTYAGQLRDALANLGRYAQTKGQRGLAFTDSTGKTRVLKEGKSEADYRRDRNAAQTPAQQAQVENEYLAKATERYSHPLLHEAVTQEEVDRDYAGSLDVALEVISSNKAEYQRRIDLVEANLRWRKQQTKRPAPLEEELPRLPDR